MKATAYLKIKKDGELAVSKYKPPVAANEVLTMLNFDIPDSLFNQPVMQANITIKEPPKTSIPNITIESCVLADWIDKKL
jgi:hypothetical protein